LSKVKNRNKFLFGVGIVGIIYTFIGVGLCFYILLDFYSLKQIY